MALEAVASHRLHHLLKMSPSTVGSFLFFISLAIWHQTQCGQKHEYKQSLHKVPLTGRRQGHYTFQWNITCIHNIHIVFGKIQNFILTLMSYRWRTKTLVDMVMGRIQPQTSSRGRQRHWPNSFVVLQAKQGQHQNAKQPSRENISHTR